MAGKFKYLAKHIVKITRGQNKGKRYTRYFYKGDVKKGTSLAKALSKEDKRALAEGFGAKITLPTGKRFYVPEYAIKSWRKTHPGANIRRLAPKGKVPERTVRQVLGGGIKGAGVR